MKLYQTVSLTALVFASTFLVAGCGSDKPVAQNGGEESSSTAVSHDDHSGWWCKEHAIPEEECSMCSCLLYTSPSPRDKRQSRMPSSA